MTLYEHPLKNAYIGEVYEYSYDFRNKSSTILTNDGWTIVTGTPTFGTYGLYATGTSNPIRLKKAIPGIIANATKIKLEYTARTYTDTSFSFGIAKTVTSSVREGVTRVYMSTGNTWAATIYGTDTTYSESISSGTTITSSIVVDLVGKTFLAKMTGKSDKTGTLTDAQVTNIRDNTTVLFPYVYGPNNSSYGLTTVSITIE